MKDALMDADSLILGISKDDLEKMRDDGIDPFETNPMDRNQRELRTRLLGNANEEKLQGFYEVNRPLRTKEERELAAKKQNFWESYDRLQERHSSQQTQEDALLVRGLLDPDKWRENRGN